MASVKQWASQTASEPKSSLVKRWASTVSNRRSVDDRAREGLARKFEGKDLLQKAYDLRRGAGKTSAPNLSNAAREKTWSAQETHRAIKEGSASPAFGHTVEHLRSEHEAAGDLHSKAYHAHLTVAAGHLSDRPLPVAFAMSARAHETGEANDHFAAAQAHLRAAHWVRGDDKAVAEHLARAADHQGLSGRSSSWEHQGASEKPMPKGHFATVASHEQMVAIGKEELAKADASFAKAKEHLSLSDRHKDAAMKTDQDLADSDWDEEKHPRDDQGRFT